MSAVTRTSNGNGDKDERYKVNNTKPNKRIQKRNELTGFDDEDSENITEKQNLVTELNRNKF